MAKQTGRAKLATLTLVAALLYAAQAGVAAAGGLLEPEGDEGRLSPLPAVGEVPDADFLASEPFLAPGPAASRWSARVGAVILQRARPASEYLVFDPVTGANLLNPDDLVFPFRGGMDVGLLWHGTVADLEFRYFGVEQWTADLGPIVSANGIDLNVPDSDPDPGPVVRECSGQVPCRALN